MRQKIKVLILGYYEVMLGWTAEREGGENECDLVRKKRFSFAYCNLSLGFGFLILILECVSYN